MKRIIALLIIFLLGGSGIALVYNSYQDNVKSSNQHTLNSTAQLIKERVGLAIDHRLNAVEDLKAFLLSGSALPTSSEFDSYSQVSMKQYPTIFALQYANTNFIIKYLYPLKGNEKALNHNLMTRAVNVPYIKKALAEKRTVTSDPFLTIQGFVGIVSRSPIYRDGKFAGLAQELFAVDLTLKDALADLKSTYKMEFSDSTGKVFWKNAAAGDSAIKLRIPIGDNFWTAKIAWQKEPQPNTAIIFIIIAVGAIIIALVSIIVNNIAVREEVLKSTVLKKTAELAASEEKFSKVFRHSSDVIGIINFKDQKYMDVSDSFYKTFEYDKEEIIGKTSTEFSLWEDIEMRNKVYHSLLNDGIPLKVEAGWRTRSGVIKTGLTSSEIIEVNGEKFIVYIWCDISERKAAEEALKTINERLEEKVRLRTQKLSQLNEELSRVNGEIQKTNQALQDEIIDHNRIEEELDLKNKELEKAYAELQETQKQIIEREKMASLGGLVAGVSHEINTPLGISISSASFLEKINEEALEKLSNGTMTKSDLREFMGGIQESVSIINLNLTRAADLIKSFKQVAVNQSNDLKSDFMLKDNIAAIIVSLKHEYKNRNIQLNNNCPADIKLNSYPGSFIQIFANLIINSIKHGFHERDSGIIDIDASIENNLLKITYKDNGHGVPEENLAKIFEPFFTTKRQNGSSGLGLNIIYNIITQKLHGSISCSNLKESGVCFIIEIPVDEVVA